MSYSWMILSKSHCLETWLRCHCLWVLSAQVRKPYQFSRLWSLFLTLVLLLIHLIQLVSWLQGCLKRIFSYSFNSSMLVFVVFNPQNYATLAMAKWLSCLNLPPQNHVVRTQCLPVLFQANLDWHPNYLKILISLNSVSLLL